MSGSDLVAANYPLTYPVRKLLGLNGQLQQSNRSIRSNLEWTGLANPTDGALAATGVACAVPIPVENGDLLSRISILVGATAGATMTHSFAALYSGIAVPALLGQSKDGEAAAIAEKARFDFLLASQIEVTPENAPNGFIYASVAITAATIPTAAVVSTPTAIGYKWFTGGPLFLSATHGSAVLGKAPATIESPAAKAVAPLVFVA